MIETIKYYYDIAITDYKNYNSTYFFSWNQNFFCFTLFEYEINDFKRVIELTKRLKSFRINYHDIILNRFGQIISDYNNKKYILFKMCEDFSKEILVWDMIKINSQISLLGNIKEKYSNNWKFLWENKINYFETQIKELAKEKENVLNTFSYYVGLGECAIQYISKVEEKYFINESSEITVCHRRIFFPNYSLNYFNPLSIIIDLEIRDYSEYFKTLFFNGIDIKDEFVSFFKTKKFSDYSYNMFFARLLFPTYYFDIYEKTLQNIIEQESNIEVLKYKSDYETFLRFAYNEINKYSSLEKIEWINNCL